jgi:hypothetical protein
MILTSDWTRTGSQQGSNDGGTYLNPEGVAYYVKHSESSDHARNEVLASRLYALAGIRAAVVTLIETEQGLGVASLMIEGAAADLKSRKSDAEYLAQIQQGFAVDAWLANWDVAGLVYDNIVSDINGCPVRIDAGGALLFRAMGAPKGGAFGHNVSEVSTLANGSNRTSAALLGSMTAEQVAQSIEIVAGLTDQQIRSAVESVGFGEQTSQTLVNTLLARRDDLAARL